MTKKQNTKLYNMDLNDRYRYHKTVQHEHCAVKIYVDEKITQKESDEKLKNYIKLLIRD